jgi:tRNA(Arg) A34 adenosine deaminase TadA
VTFINKPNVWNAVPVGSVLMDMDRMIRELKKNNLAMRKQMHAEVKAKKAAKLKEK